MNCGCSPSVCGGSASLCSSGLNACKRLAAIFACLVLAIAITTCMAPSDAYAASAKTTNKTNYVAGSKGGHLWAKDVISFKYQNGKIVSKPTVKQQASAICRIQTGIKGPIYGCYFKEKAPKIKYSKNGKTATVTTYWVCKQGFSAFKLSVNWHKACSVTYTCYGNGKVTVSKKVGKLQLG